MGDTHEGNGTRNSVREAIERSPGTYPTKVHARTGIPLSTVQYHCRTLVQDGTVTQTVIRGRHRLFPAENESPELTAALEDDVTSTILETIATIEPATVTELADELDRSRSTLSYHLDRLETDGLVDREREGCAVLTRLDPTVRESLA